MWAYVEKKQRHEIPADDQPLVGDFRAFVALDPDTKLVASCFVAKRTAENATAFMIDLSSRLANRVQLWSAGLSAYVDAVGIAFGAAVDDGQIVKS